MHIWCMEKDLLLSFGRNCSSKTILKKMNRDLSGWKPCHPCQQLQHAEISQPRYRVNY